MCKQILLTNHRIDLNEQAAREAWLKLTKIWRKLTVESVKMRWLDSNESFQVFHHPSAAPNIFSYSWTSERDGGGRTTLLLSATYRKLGQTLRLSRKQAQGEKSRRTRREEECSRVGRDWASSRLQLHSAIQRRPRLERKKSHFLFFSRTEMGWAFLVSFVLRISTILFSLIFVMRLETTRRLSHNSNSRPTNTQHFLLTNSSHRLETY